MLQAVLQQGMSDNPAKFEETWKSWEHQVDIYENLSSTKLDDDVKISVVLRECPQKLRERLQRDSSNGRGLHRQEQRQRQKQRKNLTMTENATCAEKGIISHETVGHEHTTTRW